MLMRSVRFGTIQRATVYARRVKRLGYKTKIYKNGISPVSKYQYSVFVER